MIYKQVLESLRPLQKCSLPYNTLVRQRSYHKCSRVWYIVAALVTRTAIKSDNFDFGPDRNIYFGFIHPFAGENVVQRVGPLTFDQIIFKLADYQESHS